jgi:hypothetical protein
VRFYIATKFELKDEVKRMIVELTEKGHTVSYDWTDHVPSKPYSKNHTLASDHAIVDANGVLECDVFILLSAKEKGAGYSTELGLALAANLIRNTPAIYVLGEHLDGNMFYFHPNVKRVNTLDELLSHIKN